MSSQTIRGLSEPSKNEVGVPLQNGKPAKPALIGVISALIFVLAICISLRQNWQSDVATTAMIYDAGHYQETVQLLVSTALELSHRLPPGTGASLGLQQSELAPHLLLDGPFLPFLASALWIIKGSIPTAAEWKTFVVIETICYAFSCVLMYLLARRLFRRQWFAIGTAVLWMFYPSAILGAGTFMTEGPSAMLLLAVAYCLSRLIADDGASTEGLHALTPGVPAARRHQVADSEPTNDSPSTPSGVVRVIWSALAGLCAGFLFVSKPALVPGMSLMGLALVGCLVAQLHSLPRRSQVNPFIDVFKSVAPAILALAVVVAGWMAYSFANTGHFYIGANRVPTFNIVKGTEPTTDGWGTFPQTPIALKYPESVPPGQAFREIWAAHTADCANLYARKCERLWGLPWNDYHYKCFGLSIAVQVMLHRLLVLAGTIGAAVFLGNFCRFGYAGRFVGLAAMGAVAAHAIFIPFETMSRYNFTSMPFLAILALMPVFIVSRKNWHALMLVIFSSIVFLAVTLSETTAFIAQIFKPTVYVHWYQFGLVALASFGLAWSVARFIVLSAHYQDKGAIHWSTRLSFLVLIFLASLCSLESLAHVTHSDELREWSATLKPADQGFRNISLTSVDAGLGDRPDWALLLIDSEKNLDNATITVNGQRISDPPRNLFVFNTERAIMLDGLHLWARLCRQPFEGVRQWRALPVPLSLLKFGREDNSIVVSAERGPVTVYGDYPSPANTVSLPSLKYLSGGRSLHEIQSYDMRTSEHGSAMPMLGSCVYVRQGKPVAGGDLGPSPGNQFGSYRFYLLLGYRDGSSSDSTVGQKVEPLVSKMDAISQTSPMSLSAPIEVPSDLSSPEQLRIKLSVPTSEIEKASITGGQFLLRGVSGENMFFPGEPQRFAPDPANPALSKIEIDAATHSFSKGLKSVQLTLVGRAVPFEIHGAEVSVSPVSLPSFNGHRLVLK